MKKNNKKGFTIVELVIVIAVIAILAAVLIPTFSGVIKKANQNAAMQAARNEYELYLAENAQNLTGTENLVIIKGEYAFEVVGGQFKAEAKEATAYTTQAATADLSKVYTEKSVTVGKTDVTGSYTKDGYTYTKVLSGTAEADTTYYEQGADIGSTEVGIYKN